MAIKRKLMSFKDFKKGKDSLENPAKHIIKESESLLVEYHIVNTSLGTYSLSKEGDMCSVQVNTEDAAHKFTDEDFDKWAKSNGDDEITSLICDAITNQYDEVDINSVELFNKQYDKTTHMLEFDWSSNKEESLTEKETKEMESEKLVKGNLYKIYDKASGKMLHSAAEFKGTEAKGNRFKSANLPNAKEYFITKEEMAKVVLTPSAYKPKQ